MILHRHWRTVEDFELKSILVRTSVPERSGQKCTWKKEDAYTAIAVGEADLIEGNSSNASNMALN